MSDAFNMDKLVSVIIPVFNTEKYVEKTLMSVMNQTYTNLEIIVIDDKSTDNSGMIVDELAKRDTRIRVYHNEHNIGHSLARNKGLELAHGEYYGFVDSDDYIHPCFYERLLKVLLDNEADVSVCCNTSFFDGDEETVFAGLLNEKARVEDHDEYLEHFMDRYTGSISWVCNKLYKAELFKGITFKDFFGEDIVINSEIALKVKKAAWVSDEMYAYRRRAGSTTAAGTKNIAVPAAKSCLATYDVLKGENPQFDQRLIIYTIGKHANLYANCKRDFGTEASKEIFELFAQEYDNRKDVISKASMREKFKLALARKTPALYCILATSSSS